MNKFSFTLASFLITLMLILTVTYPVPAAASGSNPNLFVSAENSQFENHFYGSMVIEVIVIDSDINYVNQIERHPYITINGDSLQMVRQLMATGMPTLPISKGRRKLTLLWACQAGDWILEHFAAATLPHQCSESLFPRPKGLPYRVLQSALPTALRNYLYALTLWQVLT